MSKDDMWWTPEGVREEVKFITESPFKSEYLGTFTRPDPVEVERLARQIREMLEEQEARRREKEARRQELHMRILKTREKTQPMREFLEKGQKVIVSTERKWKL